jgi:Protein of unknown function, DUF547
MTHLALAALAVCMLVVGLEAQDPPSAAVDPPHRAFDTVLDIYVRDGLVYYQALKQERPPFDRYLASLAGTTLPESAGRNQKLAFWLNAYNAFVLQTVIDNYPIQRRSTSFPANSIRQIPGAFERKTFRAAGRTVTLDQIEKDIIVPLGDARAVLALGRGALGGGRLKSEAFSAERIDEQLNAATRELVDRREMVFVDRQNGVLSVNPMFSWREPAFIQSFAASAAPVFASRSPLERSVLAIIAPLVVRSEAEFLEQNRFTMEFHDFDWRLNDLTNRR